MTAGQITEAIDKKYLSIFRDPKLFDESTVRKKLKEYVSDGLLKSERAGKSVVYYRAEDNETDCSDALDFFSEVSPCGVVGSYLLDRIDAHDEHFAFKHHYITQALDSDVLWTDRWRWRFKQVLRKADEVHFICEGYESYAYQKRNEWMVDRASKVIAVYNGEPGGTRNTIRYYRLRRGEHPLVYTHLNRIQFGNGDVSVEISMAGTRKEPQAVLIFRNREPTQIGRIDEDADLSRTRVGEYNPQQDIAMLFSKPESIAHAIVPKVNKDKPYKYEGFVLKKELAEFEVYEREEFSEWLTQDEYNALTEKQKRQYIFHRWNDSYGDYWIYRTIADRIWTLKGLFAEACDSDIGGSLYQGIEDSQIRVYVYRS